MSRYRLALSPAQEAVLREHCAHARYVWNLCVEQEAEWRPGRGQMPRFAGRCRQLSEARQDNPWLAGGSVIVQQQAIRDHDQAMANFFAGTHRCPSWRKAGRDEGFRIVAVRPGDVRRLSRKLAEVRVPKAGWVRFRLSARSRRTSSRSGSPWTGPGAGMPRSPRSPVRSPRPATAKSPASTAALPSARPCPRARC